MNDPTPDTGNTQPPKDPDLEVAQANNDDARPAHLRCACLGIVFIGGSLGTVAREALSLAMPPVNGIPYTIFGINVLGAFLLGVLLQGLSRREPDLGRRRTLRLLLGTGFLGGFTTYSALATDSAALIGNGASGAGVAYALATVLAGAVATWCGIAAGMATRGKIRGVD